MEQSPSREAYSHSASQEMSCRVHKTSSMVPTPSQMLSVAKLLPKNLSKSETLLFKGEGPPFVGCLQLFIQCTCNYRPYLEAVSSIHNLRMHHAVITGTHVKWNIILYFKINYY